MNSNIKCVGAIILGSAIIWAAVIVGSASALKGTDCYEEIQNILIGGVLSHLILIWSPLALLFKRVKKE